VVTLARNTISIIAISTLMGALALAGCIGGAPDEGVQDGEAPAASSWTKFKTPAVPDYPFDRAFDIVHEHHVRDLHTNSYGLELVGYSPLNEGLEAHVFSGGFIEVDVNNDTAVVASLTGGRAFTLVDISDLSAPKTISHFYSSNDNWDVRISDDGRYAFLGCQGTGWYTYSPVGQCTDYTGVPTPTGDQDNGVVTVDITDPENPRALCYTPTSSVHNLEVATYDNGTIVVANNAVQIFIMKDDGCLEYMSQVPGRHDTAIQRHPITGEMLLYTGTGGPGETGPLGVYNVDDPSDPILIGSLDTNNVGGATAWHEQSPAPNLWFDGTHILIGAGERMTGEPGPVTVINNTDPTNPVAMGVWILPVRPQVEDDTFYTQGSYMFSEHNTAVNQWGQVCVGHYHAGVWVFDVSTPERMKNPETLAFYLPHEMPTGVSTIHPAGGDMTPSPYVWGCQWSEDGQYVLTADMHSGLYILKGTWFEPADA
jgi:hypothetical protein